MKIKNFNFYFYSSCSFLQQQQKKVFLMSLLLLLNRIIIKSCDPRNLIHFPFFLFFFFVNDQLINPNKFNKNNSTHTLSHKPTINNKKTLNYFNFCLIYFQKNSTDCHNVYNKHHNYTIIRHWQINHHCHTQHSQSPSIHFIIFIVAIINEHKSRGKSN